MRDGSQQVCSRSSQVPPSCGTGKGPHLCWWSPFAMQRGSGPFDWGSTRSPAGCQAWSAWLSLRLRVDRRSSHISLLCSRFPARSAFLASRMTRRSRPFLACLGRLIRCLKLGEDLFGRPPGDGSSEVGHLAVHDLDRVLVDLRDERAAADRDRHAHLGQHLVALVRAVQIDSGSDGRAGAEPEKHSHGAAEHADQHADESAARGAATDHVVFALSDADVLSGSPLDDCRAADADPAVPVCLPQRAQCLILLAAVIRR